MAVLPVRVVRCLLWFRSQVWCGGRSVWWHGVFVFAFAVRNAARGMVIAAH